MNQFPGTNYHDLNLNWLLGQMKNCLAEWETTKGQWTALAANNAEFKAYVTNYLTNLDLTQEVSDKINSMVEDGTLLQILTEDEGDGSPLSDTVGEWLAAHITQETGYVIDDTLTVQAAAADAKAAGDAITDLRGAITDITGNARIEYTIQNAYYNTSTIGAVVSATTASNNFEAVMLDCSPGDVFTINGQGGSSGRLWAFLDEDNKVIERAVTVNVVEGCVIIAPPNSSKLVINNHKVNRPNDYSYYGDIIRYSAIVGNGEFEHFSASPIANANNAEPNKIYSIPTLSNTQNIPNRGNLVTLAYGRTANLNLTQFLFGNDGKSIYYRTNWTGSNWTDWINLTNNVVTVAPGGAGDFTSLTDAIAYSVQTENTIVIVKPGVYNLINEIGAEYMESHEYTANDRGIELYNGIKIIFDSGAFVTCNYTGENATVHKFFSAFNVSGSCEIENLNLVASNLRYAIHDENGGNITPYKVVWRGCNITFDNSQNPDWLSKKIIGGGLGKYADILIENCYFNPRNIDSAGIPNGCITYHNNTTAGSKSHVVIKDCYFEKSTFSIRWYGNSTEITDCICCGNSFTAAPSCFAETESAPYENVVLYAWNNEIRT